VRLWHNVKRRYITAAQDMLPRIEIRYQRIHKISPVKAEADRGKRSEDTYCSLEEAVAYRDLRSEYT
jgi:hypothetical protein